MERELDGTPFGSPVAWLRLAKPIPATFGEHHVAIVDLGSSGALLSGQCDCGQGAVHELVFLDGHASVNVRGIVTGIAEHDVPSHRDLLVRFPTPAPALAAFIATYQEQIHRAELANAQGDIDQNVIDGDRMLSDLGSAARANEPFLRCRLRDGTWIREITASREQPPDGFTISAAEVDDQVTLLQLAYEESDEDGRDALREFAAVSLPSKP
jgi:hypothetical protein